MKYRIKSAKTLMKEYDCDYGDTICVGDLSFMLWSLCGKVYDRCETPEFIAAFTVPVEEYDIVNRPEHYNKGEVECVNAIKSATVSAKTGFEAYLQGNIIKYLWRYSNKNGIEDLRKAEWYLKKLMEAVDEDR